MPRESPNDIFFSLFKHKVIPLGEMECNHTKVQVMAIEGNDYSAKDITNSQMNMKDLKNSVSKRKREVILP